MSIALRHLKRSPLASLALLAILAGPGEGLAQKRLYRWVDEHGRVHYSDRLPPEEVERARDELSDRGTKLRSVDRALTPEEREARRQAAIAAEEERRRREAEEQEKRKLLQMYPTEAELLRAHREQLRLVEGQINTARVALEGEEAILAQLLAQAAEADSAGKPVPPGLAQRIAEMRERVAASRAELDRHRAERARLDEVHRQALERYRAVRAEFEARLRPR